MQHSLLRGENIQFRFSDASSQFEIPSGSITAIVGSNGSGKSTLIKAFVGERVLASGGIYFFGETSPLEQLPLLVFRDRISILPQEAPYPQHVRVEDYVRLSLLFANKNARSDREEVFRRWSHRLHLTQFLQRPMRNLSSGERQRAFLLRAILKPCELLLLDEPTNHLDPPAMLQIWEALSELKREVKGGIVLSTHDLRYARRHSDWIVAVKRGRVIYCGEPGAFFERHLEETFGVASARLIE